MKRTLLFCLGICFALNTFGQTWYEKGKNTDDPLLKVDYYTRAIEEGEKSDAWIYYFRGWAFYDLEKYHRTLQDFLMADKKEGNLDKGYLYTGLAWTYYRMNDTERGVQAAEKARTLNPKIDDAWNVSGWLAINEDKFADAVRYFGEYINRRPDSYFGYSSRSYAYTRLDRYDLALQDVEKGLSLEPGQDYLVERKALCLLMLDREDEAMKIIKEKIDYKDDDPLSLSNVGNLYYRNGNYRVAIAYQDQAIALYNKKIKDDPKAEEVYREDIYNIYMSRGDAYEALDDHFNALADYTKATTLVPEDYRAWYEIGELQTFKENWKEAVHAYERAFQCKPDLEDGWVNLGFSYSNLHLDRKAIDAYTRGIKVNPEQGLLYNNRGFTYLEGGEYDKAFSDLQQAIQVEPQIVMSHVSLGEYYEMRGEWDAAIPIFNRALDMENGSKSAYTAAYFKRGLCYLGKEEYEKAEADFKAALQITPGHVLAWESLGLAHFHQEEEACEAYKAFKKALELDSKQREKECKQSGLYLAKLTRNPCG